MRKRLALTLSILCGIVASVVLTGCGKQADEPEPLRIHAAASTTNVIRAVAEQFTKETGTPTELNFAASSTLARQIEAGAPADIYISANVKWMDYLEEKDLLVPDSRKNLFSNSLVLIAPAQAPFEFPGDDFAALPDAFEGRLSIGDPAHVPAGMYAKAALESLGIWQALEPRIAGAADVRNALRLVETGEASAGIVYKTDALITDKVVVLATLPPESHPPVAYPVAQLKDSHAEAGDFLNYLKGASAREVFIENGFSMEVRDE